VRALFLTLVLAAPAALAQAVLVDRLAAVVDAHPITRSAVDARATLLGAPPTGEAREKARAEALTSLIDDWLIRLDAERRGLTVESAEVERALGDVAAQNNLTVSTLLTEVTKHGFTSDGYRLEVRRQLLEFKWLSIAADRAARPSEPDALMTFMASERARLLAALRRQTSIEVKR
jgi:peptidyl-prolyl cis-trans isomerase SurA